MNYDVIILGGGPAGLSCGIYTARAKLKTLIVEYSLLPPQMVLTDIIENYPGFPEGINGFDLLEKFKRQAANFGCEFSLATTEPKIKIVNSDFTINIENNIYNTKTIVIATGRKPKPLGIENETKFVGRGISYCGICDAALFKDKVVCVVGGGNTALQESLFISRFVKKLYLIHRRKQFRGAKILLERLTQKNNVEVITPATVIKILGDTKVESLEINYVDTNTTQNISCDGIFIFVGETPNTEFVKNIEGGKVELDENGYIITNEHLMTSIKGIFACGDCRKNPLKQVVVACSEGAIVAEVINNYLENSI